MPHRYSRIPSSDQELDDNSDEDSDEKPDDFSDGDSLHTRKCCKSFRKKVWNFLEAFSSVK